MTNKTLTIMFIDVQGYTSLTTQKTRDEQQLFVHEIKSFVEKHVKEKSGRLVKAMGDGFLATFESPTDAITSGKNIQKEISRRNASVLNPQHLIAFRIGISTGEATLDESGDVFGDVVNIAARIQKFAEPNEVFISESTYLAMNTAEIKAQDLGPQSFKNVLRQVRVFKVIRDDALTGPTTVQGGDEVKKTHAYLLVGVTVLSIILAVYFAVKYYGLRSKFQEKLQQHRQGFMNQMQPMMNQDQQSMRSSGQQMQRRQNMQPMMQQGQGGMQQGGQEGMMGGSQQQGQGMQKSPCGDGVCDQVEQSNPNLCPQDCPSSGK